MEVVLCLTTRVKEYGLDKMFVITFNLHATFGIRVPTLSGSPLFEVVFLNRLSQTILCQDPSGCCRSDVGVNDF